MAGMSKKDLEKALAEAMEKVQQQQQELERLSKGRRPQDALNLGGVIAVFSNKTHQDLVGRKVKCHIPEEAIGSLYASCTVKRTKNGNAFLTLRGWIDPSKLDLRPVEGGDDEDVSKATKSAKEALGL